MLRRTAQLLLPHGALAQQAAACSNLQFSTFLGQTRSRSDPITTPVTESFSSYEASSSGAAADGLDLPAGELLSHADSIISASEAAEAAVYAAVKAECWMGTRGVLDVLSWTHQYMPWFEALAISGVVLKLCTLPLTYLSEKNRPKMAAIRADTEQMSKLKEQIAKVQTHAEFDRLNSEFLAASREYGKKHKGTLLYTLGVPLLGLAQTVVLISHFSAVATLARAKLPSMTYEGGLWLSDLTLPDPYYGMPILAAVATLVMLNSKQTVENMKQLGPKGDKMQRFSLIFALVLIPVGHYTPSAIALLWGCNALLTVAQNAAFGNAGFRKVVGLPPLSAAVSKSSTSFLGSMVNKLEALSDPQKAAKAERAAAASRAASAPPPASRPAVNYLTSKPRRKKAALLKQE